MEKISVRLSIPEDIPDLRDIYNEQVLHGVATFDTEEKSLEDRQKWFALHQNPKYPLISAEHDGRVVGWGSLSPFHTRPAYDPTTEFSIYIHKDYRGQGLGALILQDLLVRAKEAGFHSVIGLISGSNEASISLAVKFGFQEVGRYREVGKKFGQWLDVVLVQLMLAAN